MKKNLKKKLYWIVGIAAIIVIVAFIILIFNSSVCTDGCGTAGLALHCQADNDCKYIEHPPVPGTPGCYNLKGQSHPYVNDSKQCECINSICRYLEYPPV